MSVPAPLKETRDRLLPVYAEATLALREALQLLGQGQVRLPPRVVRASVRVASLALLRGPELRVALTLALVHRGPAERAAQAGLLVGAALPPGSVDLEAMSRFALVAGLPELARAIPPASGEAVELSATRWVGAGGVGLLGISAAACKVVSVARQVTLLEHGGEPDGPIAFIASLIYSARRLLELIAPTDAKLPPQSPALALARLAEEPGVMPLAHQLLLEALGPLAPGTVVELSNGAWAVTVGPPRHGSRRDRPRVLQLTSPRGAALDRPIPLELEDLPELSIRALIPAEQARFNTAGAVLAGER